MNMTVDKCRPDICNVAMPDQRGLDNTSRLVLVGRIHSVLVPAMTVIRVENLSKKYISSTRETVVMDCVMCSGHGHRTVPLVAF